MAAKESRFTPLVSDSAFNEVAEECDRCERETPHEVTITIARTSREDGAHAKYSREPCRVSICRDCGTRTTIRMNHV